MWGDVNLWKQNMKRMDFYTHLVDAFFVLLEQLFTN